MPAGDLSEAYTRAAMRKVNLLFVAGGVALLVVILATGHPLLLAVTAQVLILLALFTGRWQRVGRKGMWFAWILLVLVPATVHLYRVNMRAENPDPNHTHADFSVWIDSERVDFSQAKYISGGSETHTEEQEKHKYFHLHDGNGNVLHRHKPGLPIGQFFASLGFTLMADCLATDDGRKVCDTDGKTWRFFVNGVERPMDPEYIFEDGDRLLWSYGADDVEIAREIREVTDDACRYSRTCPGRGDPPTESCIADPTVPCRIVP